MNSKDTIYIDIEDDITAIIGKVKASKHKIVALVPPKRVGVLQSAVNLKLLQKAAAGGQKRVVLITNDHSLTALAAGVKMPVAKNLQSRPEIPQLEAPAHPDEEVIEGDSIPVGEFARSLGVDAALHKKGAKPEEIEEKVEVGEIAADAADVEPPKQSAADKAKAAAAKVKSRIPNFDTFRKRLFLVGGGAIALIIFLIWAIVFAPHATITITAKTSPISVNKTLTLDTNAQQSDTGKLQLKPTAQQVKKPVTTEFTATGSKDIGNKATGSITVRNCDYADGELNLPAGTRFTGADGKAFVSTEAVSVPGYSGLPSTCTLSGGQSGKKAVSVEAVDLGPEYNIGGQTYKINVPGKVDGVDTTGMSGGTRETVQVVSQEDVDKAKELLPKADQDAAKAELKQLFTADQIVIDESFEVKTADVVSAPKVGEQGTKATLTQETTYTIVSLQRSDTDAILKTAVDEALLGKSDQQAYSYGEDTISFQDYQRTGETTTTARLVTAGFVGPKIDVEQLVKQIEGQRYGEIQALVSAIPGVQSVNIDLSPFWVSRAPGADKIDIKFSVAN